MTCSPLFVIRNVTVPADACVADRVHASLVLETAMTPSLAAELSVAHPESTPTAARAATPAATAVNGPIGVRSFSSHKLGKPNLRGWE